MKLCECGCGGVAPIAKRTRTDEGVVRGQPTRFIQHHQRRHGHKAGNDPTREYNSWRKMRERCCNPNAHNYPRYGGRGITVDPRWRVFENFLADMGPRPSGTTLDRIDVDGNYEPGNCRWATPAVQIANRRRSTC